MSGLITRSEIALYREATGCPIADVAATLEGMPQALRRRVLAAAAKQKAPLHDPIEDDPGLSVQLASSEAKAEDFLRVRGLNGKRGACHAQWSERQRILREEFNIEWYSPAEMNPHVTFD